MILIKHPVTSRVLFLFDFMKDSPDNITIEKLKELTMAETADKSKTKKIILIIIAIIIIILACLYGCIAKGKPAPAAQTTEITQPAPATLESATPAPAQPAPQPAPAPKPAPAPEPQKSIFPDNSADYPVTEK